MAVTSDQFQELVKANRSYRRFDEDHELTAETLRDLVALARITPSGMNRQPLKYAISATREMNAKIFDTLAWAGSLKDWQGPGEGERPTGYIVVLVDTSLRQGEPQDVGISAQTILLGAVAEGLGGCMLGAINKPALKKVLALPDSLSIALVIALGKPVEAVVLEDAPADGNVTYYREPDGTHHVPKRGLDEIIVQTHA